MVYFCGIVVGGEYIAPYFVNTQTMNSTFKTIIFVVGALFLLNASGLAQNVLTQTLRGQVVDADNNQRLSGVSVKLVGTEKGTLSDTLGQFRLISVPIGRYTLQLSRVGYETQILSEVLLEAGKEKILTIHLKETTQQLSETVVRAARPSSQTSLQTITIEQTLRFAGTFFDPARLATSFPGVSAANDQANGLVIRGNSPTGTQWRLEGVEIVNPNHLSNAGTFSDRPTQTGGGTNILSAQLMERADFMTGAFPSEYGNVLGGVMDVHLRKGNDQKHEFTGQVGLIGVDFAAEGPLSKKNKSSYLVNYRYSFTGLLAMMGVKFGGEDIRFQDIAFNLSFPTKKAGHFTVFGMAGASSNVFKAERDTTLWEFQKDGFDIKFKNRMGAVGLTHSLNLSRNTLWKTTVAISGLETRREGYQLNKLTFARNLTQVDAFRKTRYSLSTSLSHKITPNLQWKEGVIVTYQQDSVQISNGGISKGQLEGFILQPYVAMSGRLAPRVTFQAGLHLLTYTYNKTHSLEPRLSLRYGASGRTAFTASYGLHSQLQLPQTYLSLLFSDTQLNNFPNKNLGFTKAHHYVVGWEQQLTALPKQSSLKVEAYYQSLFNVPVALANSQITGANSFSALNLIEGFSNVGLENKGTGKNYGVEATYQQFLSKDFYALVTASLYNSTYKGQDGVERNTRFNGNHTFSLAAGKEFHKRINRTFGVNVRVLWLGGYLDSPIDVKASQLAGQTIYKVSELYTIKLKDYFRPDVRVFWKRNKPNYTRTWSIDIQNLTNTENEAYSYFDTFQGKTVQQFQLGMIPVINYRVEF